MSHSRFKRQITESQNTRSLMQASSDKHPYDDVRRRGSRGPTFPSDRKLRRPLHDSESGRRQGRCRADVIARTSSCVPLGSLTIGRESGGDAERNNTGTTAEINNVPPAPCVPLGIIAVHTKRRRLFSNRFYLCSPKKDINTEYL